MSAWSLVEDTNGIATLTLDVPDHRHNVLSVAVVGELERQLVSLGGRSLRGLIIASAKPTGFIIGADVHEFRHIADAVRAAELTRAGQLVLRRLAQLPYPTVAIIDGPCLGGGLELALACRYRIASEDERTVLSLPEVRLGIHPGFAGTVRLPQLIGGLPALSMILTGRRVSARRARRLGLVDAVVAARHLPAAAVRFLHQVPARTIPRWYYAALDLPLWRPLVAMGVRQALVRRVNPDHYPAPARALALWAHNASEEAEALSCAELLVSPASRHLVRLFELGEELKRNARLTPHHVEHVHIVGAGVMGADIAAWTVSKGFTVSLQDCTAAALAKGVKRAHAFFSQKLRGPAQTAARDRLMPDLNGHGLTHADLVIEAIVEDVAAKRALFATLEARVGETALLATNTSSIPLDVLAQGLKNPARLVGLHFFNPVAKMQLVEVIGGSDSSAAARAQAAAFAVALDRLPIGVRSTPGFLVNRVLMPYLLEAMVLAEEGVPLDTIDAAAKGFGMPMGPIALADTVGLDICLSVARTLAPALDLAVPPLLERLVDRGALGCKSGRGFYTYPRPRRWTTRPPPMAPAVTDRLILRLVNEAGRCLREGVVADADLVDIGLVYGTGFAPFRGGPLGYAESQGLAEIGRRLDELRAQHGARFDADGLWASGESLARRPLVYP
ncbi:MAG: 3-hydroxyacyl-CoA dehydrogenase NAD-binding domain-containing protein [Acidiferrobacter sp.]